MIVPADRIVIDGDTGWAVVEFANDERGPERTQPIDVFTLNRPCETCDPHDPGYVNALRRHPCPADCIDGRHTFDLRVRRACPADTDGDGDCAFCYRNPTFHDRTYRASILRVLPIVYDPGTVPGDVIEMGFADADEALLWTVAGTCEHLILPSAAAPGMYAVELRVRS